ncbi:rho guanine nucleotide exchange factor 7-like isoform X2 [Oculina patagonica]
MRLKPRQIESWFVALGLLEQRQKSAEHEFDSYLQNILKDGSILCRLVNRVKPGTINKIHQEPISEEERLENFSSFFSACQELQLADDQIFSPADLDTEEGFARVLRTLDRLENVATGYGLGKQFTQHHEVTTQDTAPESEQEVADDTRHLEMTDYGGGIHLVKAAFPFNGRDEDELCFERGEILEVTKAVDGGWWEGTLNGKVGWFPSNYVKEISASPEPTTPITPQPSSLSSSKRESARVYHNLVVQNILDTERAHVSELQALLQNYLKPLQGSNILPAKDMKVLAGNFEEIVQFQQMFFNIMDECSHLPLPQQRMGASYLQIAPQMKELYVTYCANHPRAVEVLTKYSDELSAFIESKGAPAPGILTLTTSLSNPFRHLGKYPNHMKELERHLEEGHVDELDTKKAIAVFQNLTTSCHETRKRKETELEMLTGTIEGWEEEDISKEGDLILMSQFLIHGENGEVRERSFLLFPNSLIILSVNANACGYRFEKKYGLSDLTIHSLEDSEGILNAFEIRVSGDVMKLSTNHPHEKTAWLDTVQFPGQSPKVRQHSEKSSVTSPSPWVERHTASLSERTYSKSSPPRSDSIGSPPNSATPKGSLSTSGVHSQSSSDGSKFRSVSTSHSVATDLTTFSSAPHSPNRRKHWDFTRLRPTPPLRPAYALIAKEDTSTAHRSMRGLLHPSKKKQVSISRPSFKGRSKSELEDEKHSGSSGKNRVLEEDMLILQVVEAYCTSARARHTLNNKQRTEAISGSPILPELPAHRTSSSSFKGDLLKSKKSKKKSTRDVVGEFNCLRRRVEELQLETESLRQSLQEEQNARKKMEKFIRCSLKGVIPDMKWEDIDKS